MIASATRVTFDTKIADISKIVKSSTHAVQRDEWSKVVTVTPKSGQLVGMKLYCIQCYIHTLYVVFLPLRVTYRNKQQYIGR